MIRVLACDTDLWADPVWVVDSTPVECARSRPTVKRSNLAGWAGYSYCASHSRFFWGLRLHLIATLPNISSNRPVESIFDTRSKGNSTWNSTAAAASTASAPGSGNASSP